MSLSFCPLACLQRARNAGERFAVVILNKDVAYDGVDPIFKDLWKRAVFRACADGGANYVYDLQEKLTNGNSPPMPDLISGDFDSIRPEVKEYYEKQPQTSVVPTPDQDETDFTKCIKLIGERMEQKRLSADLVIAIGGKQDRFDHSMANVNTLYKAGEIIPKTARLCLFYGSSYLTLLPKGKSVINVATGLEGTWCGLIPVGRPATLTTSGLKWNLSGHKMEFGELISTSNELGDSETVVVETDQPLVWTIEFKIPRN